MEKCQTYNDFDQLLPMQVDSFLIKKLDWDDFPGVTEEDSIWNACTYWKIKYNYDIVMKQMSSHKPS